MLRALALSVDQLGDRAILAILAKSLAITLVLCLALGFGLARGIALMAAGSVDRAILADYGDLLAAVAMVLTVIFGFRAIAVPVVGLFADGVVAAVEQRHYPARAAEARPVSLAVSARLGLMSALRMILVNLLFAPLYLVLVFTVIGPLVAILAVNAILLGRDLGDMVAVRHMPREAVASWRRANRMPLVLMGLIVSGLFIVPIVNFVAPIIGAALATHLFHGKDAP